LPYTSGVDIHPPHAIRSWRDFFIQIATITTGILIALSLEGAREAMHNRSIAAEARENIRRELVNNKREVDNELAQAVDRAPQLEQALQFANDLLATKKTKIEQFGLNFHFPSLSDASWQTAQRTGALSQMDYAEVQKYAHAYSVQSLLEQQDRRALELLSDALGFVAGGSDPENAPRADLERFRQQITTLRSILFVGEQLSHTASEAYQTAIDQK
jgi:plasmid stability protein